MSITIGKRKIEDEIQDNTSKNSRRRISLSNSFQEIFSNLLQEHGLKFENLLSWKDKISFVVSCTSLISDEKFVVKGAFNHPNSINLEEEETILIKLQNSPHILKIIRTIDLEEPFYFGLVFPFLSSAESFKPINQSEFKSFFHQLFLGIQSCHNLSIAHYDIKPQNILFKRNENGGINVVLADFGLAMGYHEILYNQGTTRYKAPELLKLETEGTASVNLRGHLAVDIWSAGVVFWEFNFNSEWPDEEDSIFQKINEKKFPFSFDTKKGEEEGKEKEEEEGKEKGEEIESTDDKFKKKLIQGMLELDPQKRFSVQDLLISSYFS